MNRWTNEWMNERLNKRTHQSIHAFIHAFGHSIWFDLHFNIWFANTCMHSLSDSIYSLTDWLTDSFIHSLTQITYAMQLNLPHGSSVSLHETKTCRHQHKWETLDRWTWNLTLLKSKSDLWDAEPHCSSQCLKIECSCIYIGYLNRTQIRPTGKFLDIIRFGP